MESLICEAADVVIPIGWVPLRRELDHPVQYATAAPRLLYETLRGDTRRGPPIGLHVVKPPSRDTALGGRDGWLSMAAGLVRSERGEQTSAPQSKCSLVHYSPPGWPAACVVRPACDPGDSMPTTIPRTQIRWGGGGGDGEMQCGEWARPRPTNEVATS